MKRLFLLLIISFTTVSCTFKYQDINSGRYVCYGTVEDGWNCYDSWAVVHDVVEEEEE